MAFFSSSSTLLRSLKSPCDAANPLRPAEASSAKRSGYSVPVGSTSPPGCDSIHSSPHGSGGVGPDLKRWSSCSALQNRRTSATASDVDGGRSRARSAHETAVVTPSPSPQKGGSSVQRESVDGVLLFSSSPVTTTASANDSFPSVSATAPSEMLCPLHVSERRARAVASGGRRGVPRSTGGCEGTVQSSPTMRLKANAPATTSASAPPPPPPPPSAVNAENRTPAPSPSHPPRTSSAAASPGGSRSSSSVVARLVSPLTRRSPIALSKVADAVSDEAQPYDPSRYATISVDLSNCRYDIVRHVFEDVFGFDVTSFNTVPVSSAVTDVLPGSMVYWSDRSLAPMRVHRLLSARCVANHFPGIELLCRKVSMGRFLAAMANVFPQHYHFFPRTFLSYEEFNQATAARSKWSSMQRLETVANVGGTPAASSSESCSGDPYYICKPNGGCCGRDIVITQRITPFSFDGVVRAARVDGERQQDSSGQADPCVVQQYIHRPLLVDGRKCDLRCYVLIASWDPLTICFYREGIVRLCASPYEEPSEGNCKSMSVHLANYAVNKKKVAVQTTHRSAHGSAEANGNGEVHHDDGLDGNGDHHFAASSEYPEQSYGQAHRLKRTFDSYNRFLLQHIQRSERLLRIAEDRHAQRHGKRPSPTPQVLLATSLVEELWFHIHSVVIMSILSAYKTIRQQCPPCPSSNNGGSTSYSIPHAPPSAVAVGGGATSGTSASSTGKRLVNTASPSRRSSSTTGNERATGRTGDGSNSSSSSHSLPDSDEQTAPFRDANQHIKTIASQSPFFEILGFDILVDDDLKPWLIEINHSPSWSADSPFDTELKRRVLRDALRLCVLPRFCASSSSSAAARLASAKTRLPTSGLSRQLRASVADARSPGSGSGSWRRSGTHGEERSAASKRSWRDFDAEYRLEGNRFQQIFPVPPELRNVEQFKGLTEVCDYVNVRM